jgi:hypothetical protein
MRRFSIGRAAVLGVAACLAVAIPALAQPVTVRVDSKITISESPPAFHGKVKADNAACEPNRKVKLFRKQSGPDELLGKDTTDSDGKWKVAVHPLSSGAYYAKVRRREEGTAGTIYVCHKDVSRTVVVD